MTTSAEQVEEPTSGARTAVDRSAELWRRRTEQVTAGASVLVTLPSKDMDQSTEQYFEYLQRSLEINRQLAKRWTDALSAFSGAAQSHTESLGEAVRGHTEAIRDWLTAEIDTLQQATVSRTGAAKQAQQELARQPYHDLPKPELADELGRRDLPTSGTAEEVLERLHDADTR